jgi:ankyrin repeat protein/limonene-1,2-epoxide hydrolase
MKIDDRLDQIKHTLFNDQDLLHIIFVIALKNNDINAVHTIFGDSTNIKKFIKLSSNEIFDGLAVYVVQQGFLDVLKFLITELGYDLKVEREQEQIDLLSVAISNNHYQIAEFLIMSGFTINTHDRDGLTPLHRAIQSGNKGLVELVISDENIDYQDAQLMTPLHHAAIIGDREIIKLLLTRGSNTKLEDSQGYTWMHILKMFQKGRISVNNGNRLTAEDDKDKWVYNHVRYFKCIYSFDNNEESKGELVEISKIFESYLESRFATNACEGECFEDRIFEEYLSITALINIYILINNNDEEVIKKIEDIYNKFNELIDSSTAIYICNDLRNLYLLNNNLEEAEKYAKITVSCIKKDLSEENSITNKGHALCELAFVLHSQHKYNEAKESIDEALLCLPRDQRINELNYRILEEKKFSEISSFAAQYVEIGYLIYNAVDQKTSIEYASEVLKGFSSTINPEEHIIQANYISLLYHDLAVKIFLYYEDYELCIKKTIEYIDYSLAFNRHNTNSLIIKVFINAINYNVNKISEILPTIEDDLVKIEILNILGILDLAEETLSSTELDPKFIHEYYTKQAQKHNIITPEQLQLPSIITWHTPKGIFNSNNEKVHKIVTGQGKTIYAIIYKKIGTEFMPKFTKALGKGFVRGERNEGVKLIKNKVFEIKIHEDKRLYTTVMYKNLKGEYLLIFDNIGNHNDVANAVNKCKGIKIKETTDNLPFEQIEGANSEGQICGNGDNGLYIRDVIAEIEKINGSSDGNININIEKAAAKVEELNKAGKYVYIINPQGEESTFREEVKLLKKENTEVICSGMQRDDHTCCDHSLILLDLSIRKLKGKYEEAGIVTVRKEDKIHGLLYIATDGKSEIIERVMREEIEMYKDTWMREEGVSIKEADGMVDQSRNKLKQLEVGAASEKCILGKEARTTELAILRYEDKEGGVVDNSIGENIKGGIQYNILSRLNKYVEKLLEKLVLANRKAEMQKLVDKYGVVIEVKDRESLQSAYKEIAKKTHPDRNVNSINIEQRESFKTDFIKATELVNKVGGNKIVSEMCNPIMEKLMGINVALRVTDVAIDTVRGLTERTEENVMKASIGYVQLAAMYQGQYGIMSLITCKEAVYQIYQGEYGGATMSATIGIGLPLMATAIYTQAPVVRTVMSIGLTLHLGYRVLNNMYDLGYKATNSAYDLYCNNIKNNESKVEEIEGSKILLQITQNNTYVSEYNNTSNNDTTYYSGKESSEELAEEVMTLKIIDGEIL